MRNRRSSGVEGAQASRLRAGLAFVSLHLGAELVWSEDLNAGQRYGEPQVRSPF